jgi:flagellar motor switch protein FliG
MSGTGVVGVSGKDFLQKTVPKAFGSKKADDLLGDLLSKNGPRSFERLNSLNPSILANLLLNEHPQTIALILVNMKHQTAAEILQQLPEEVQSEVVVRIADLEEVPNEVVSEIHDVIEELLSDIDKDTSESLGGIETAAEILNQLDQKTENAIFEKIESEREELADEIRQKMFLFEDLIELDDRSIRTLLKEIGNDELMLALKTAPEELLDKIFSNVSQRAAEMMKEDMEVMGPVKLRDVEQAQMNIIKTARRLEEEGKLVLGGKGSEEVLV